MKVAKTAVAIFLSSVVLTGVANAAAFPVTSDQDNITIIGTQGAGYNLDLLAKDAVIGLQTANDASTKADTAQTTANQAQADATLAGIKADSANNKAYTALQGVAKNGSDIIDLKNKETLQDGVLANHDLRITTLENQTPPKDGIDGKDGVTTTVTQVKVDATTQAKVDANAKATSSTAQDLQATKQTLQALNNNTNQQFKSLHDEVDNNKKEANAGISGAMAMAGLPQVQTNQRTMFSAGGATYNGESALAVGASVNFNEHMVGKVSFSDDTANNMGASVGVGIGF
ncbi:YadA C-terminal domain-containing protein [Enterobacter asburiae]|uniref:YadA C-terminal domain-containing protein n=1 Tax=Enterobacter asburiae TaxID=61645 RepID=UPI001652418A|nr:YadA C-terminal domain-containing protein [Enterobacter asburiae]